MSLVVGLIACRAEVSGPPADSTNPAAAPVEQTYAGLSEPASSDTISTAQPAATDTPAPTKTGNAQNSAIAPVENPASITADSAALDRCFDDIAFDSEDTTVNMRDRPDGDIVATLPNRTVIRQALLDGETDRWRAYSVAGTDQSGFVFSDLIYRSYYQVQDPTDPTANLRSSPNGDLITALSNGTEVRFLSVSQGWTQVSTASGQQGYIQSSRLQPPDCF